MLHVSTSSNAPETLNRSIDRFLFAAGWRVSAVEQRTDGSGFEVTLSQIGETGTSQTVTRFASSAGEATLKACSSARALMLEAEATAAGSRN